MKKKNTQVAAEVPEEEVPDAEDGTTEPAASRGTSIFDLIMRIVAFISILGSTIAMATTNQTLPSFTQFMRFKGEYQSFPTFRFFMVSNAMASAYLVLSLALSIFHILKSGAKMTRAVLIILDTIIFSLLLAGASAAAAIADIAHKGIAQANWFAICQQQNYFCERLSGSLVGSFIGVLVLMLLIFLSAVALSRM